MEQERTRIPAYLIIGKVITYAMYLWVLFGVIVLGMRVFMLAFSANATTPFVKFIYNTSSSYLEPFRGIFPPKPIGDTGYLDVAALFAIIVYALIGWGFSALIHYIQRKVDIYASAPVETQTLQRQEPAIPVVHASHVNHHPAHPQHIRTI